MSWLGARLRHRRFTGFGIGRVGRRGSWDVRFFLVGWQDLVGHLG